MLQINKRIDDTKVFRNVATARLKKLYEKTSGKVTQKRPTLHVFPMKIYDFGVIFNHQGVNFPGFCINDLLKVSGNVQK